VKSFSAMMQISSTFESAWLTPRTANYVAALIREGDNFDYCKWLQQVRAEETPARELRKAKTEQIVSEEIGAAVGTCLLSALSSLSGSRTRHDFSSISKWARALRYVAGSKVAPAQLKAFM
jgi:hypothetical protein